MSKVRAAATIPPSTPVGVLALQGDFSAHQEFLHSRDRESSLIKKASQLDKISGLVIPGGESTTFLKLLDEDLKSAIIAFAKVKPIFGTCAGCILLADKVLSPEQTSLKLIPIAVERNAYGRQAESFNSEDVIIHGKDGAPISKTSGRFIRAPKIIEYSPKVRLLASLKGEAVALAYNLITVSTFHPELDRDISSPIYEHFLSSCL